MKIIQTATKTNSNFIELPKYTFIHGVKLQDVCTACNKEWEWDLSKEPLYCPRPDTPITVTGYCKECENEWTVGQVVLTVKVSVDVL